MIRYDEKHGARIKMPEGHRLLQFDNSLSARECTVTLLFGSSKLGSLRNSSHWDFMSRYESMHNHEVGAQRRQEAIDKEMATAVEITMDYGDYLDMLNVLKEVGR